MPRFVAIATLLMIASGCSRAAQDRPRAQYDPKTGRLTRLAFSSTNSGANDAVAFMDGTRIERLELDQNHDGTSDRCESYARDGTIVRVDVSTARDGRFDRSEFYESSLLARVEQDTNGDGRVDQWESYRTERDAVTGALATEVGAVAFDDTHRGTPNRRLVFDREGRVARIEIDPDGDGTFIDQRLTQPR
jgi:hypothetical protein